MVMSALETLDRDLGDEVAFYGLICGPFTLALHLLGNDIFLDMFDRPDKVKTSDRLLRRCRAFRRHRSISRHGADVIAVVDPMTSQISPEHFEEFVTPAVNKVFDHIRDRGGLSSMFVCGDVTRNLEVMCRTHADNISVDEQISMDHLRRSAPRTASRSAATSS